MPSEPDHPYAPKPQPETFFPSDADRKRLHGQKMTSLSSLSDEDRYRYHAYNYGWQRAMLGRYERHEPEDPQGDWYVANMADRAEDYQRKKMGMPARRRSPPMPLEPSTVRPHWRQLLVRDLTEAERALAEARVDEIRRRAHAENPRAAARAEAMTRRAIPGKLLSPAEINAALGIAPAEEISLP